MPPTMAEVDPSLSDTTPHSGAGGQGADAGRFDPMMGSVLAERYAIVRKIGEGGMGAVYEARHAVIGKRVAVKVLLEKFLENQELMARLLQEARMASSIGHENIVDVTDYGTTKDGRAYVVMEFLDGESLAQLVIRDAPLPVERSLNILRQVSSALTAAHAKGIVHRDVKPENIYLVRRGDLDFVKVVDFGVSKAVHASDEGPERQRLTRTGTVLGTPLYMSPEQARGGEDVDHRADIWSAGLLLYECLTGGGSLSRQQLPGRDLAGAHPGNRAAVAAAARAGHSGRRGPRGHACAGQGSRPALPADGRVRARPRASAGGRFQRGPARDAGSPARQACCALAVGGAGGLGSGMWHRLGARGRGNAYGGTSSRCQVDCETDRDRGGATALARARRRPGSDARAFDRSCVRGK